MTDNYYFPNQREVFGLVDGNKLYTFSNKAYYGIINGATSGKIFWDTRAQLANTTFSGTPLNDGTGRTQLFLNTQSGVRVQFLVSTVSSNDANQNTGFHINFFAGTATAAQLGTNYVVTNLYLSPVSRG